MRFLWAHHKELSRLRDFPGNEGAMLDFPVEDRDVAVQTDMFPPELLAMMADLKIALTISRYPRSPKKSVILSEAKGRCNFSRRAHRSTGSARGFETHY
jgi:hypothetical protein